MSMMSAATDCPLPANADPAWLDEQPGYRLIWSRPMVAAGQEIRFVVTQRDDGTIPTDGDDEPIIHVGRCGYPVVQARALAESILCAANLVDEWVGQMDVSTTVEPQLAADDTSYGEFDPEDGTRSIHVDIAGSSAVQVWAEEHRDGLLTDIGILFEQSDDGYSATQIREMIPMLLEAADLADRWEAQ